MAGASSTEGEGASSEVLPAEAERAEEDALWSSWKRARDPLARTKIILGYLPFAKSIARSIRATINPDYVDFADLVQLATLGLIEAVDRFDFERGIPFRGFAEKRVRGAVLNGVADQSEMHAQGAYRKRYRQERVESLRPTSSRKEPELFADMVDMALGLAVGLMLEGTHLFQDPGDSLSRAYGEPGELAAQSQRFQKLLVHLPETERAILELHYSHGLQFSEVAQVLGLSKGRISQLHKGALKALRQLLRSRPGLDLRM